MMPMFERFILLTIPAEFYDAHLTAEADWPLSLQISEVPLRASTSEMTLSDVLV